MVDFKGLIDSSMPVRSIRRKIVGSLSAGGILIAPFALGVVPALAASSFTNHLWQFANGAGNVNIIDLNKGGSKIYDNKDLHVSTDNNLYLDAPNQVTVSNDLAVGQALTLLRNGKNIGGSHIYENGQLHIATDDHLYLDAPIDVNVSNGLNVGGDLNVDGASNVDDLTVNGTLTFDGSNLYTASTGVLGNFEVGTDDGGDLAVDGNITMQGSDRHALLWLANDGDLQVDGHTTLGSSHWDDLTVNATSEFNSDISVYESNVNLEYSNLKFTYGCGECGDYWQQYANTDSGNFVLYNGVSDTDILAVSENGDVTIQGPNRHATLDLANDGDLNVEGNTTLGSSHWDSLAVNATSNFNNDVTLGSDSSNSVTVNGRLYGESGGPVTVGHYSDTNGLKVWGDTDLRGDLSVGGWGTAGNLQVLSASTDCGYDGPGGCVTLGGDSYNGIITVDGRLIGGDGDPVTIGHHQDSASSDNGLKVWGSTNLEGGAQIGATWNPNDLSVYGDTTLQDKNWGLALNVENPDGDSQLVVDSDCGCVTIGSNSEYDQTIFNSRLYGLEGSPVTVGRYSDNNDFKVWGDSDLRGQLTVGGWGSDGNGINVQSGDLNVNNGSLYVSDNLTVDGGGLDVWGNSSFNDDLTVAGNTTLTGTLAAGATTVTSLTVSGAFNPNGAVTFGGVATFNSSAIYNGSATYGGTAHYNGAATYDSSLAVGGTLSASAGVDFSGASSFRVPVTASVLVDNVTACSVGGRITFSTNDNRFYGCDGTHWQALDN